ncbi:hypothetical protein [Bradyrhizobium sp. McL0616]|uniref:hypothetical protein n=1 Tax=Bradyrhizobium sp. McL0616 TaxID=3415674 RepID=UPI003CEB5CAB
MIRRRRALRALAVAVAAVPAFACAASAQGLGRGKGNSGPPPVEDRPKIDEKAYKAALDRIPVPDEKYDPWSGARARAPAKPPKKKN